MVGAAAGAKRQQTARRRPIDREQLWSARKPQEECGADGVGYRRPQFVGKTSPGQGRASGVSCTAVLGGSFQAIDSLYSIY